MAIQLKFAARCEAAGRDHNEDNFLLDDSLSDANWGFQSDKVIDLDQLGSLLVCCDGMGGMNAGEVASDVAVTIVKQWFQKERLDSVWNDISQSDSKLLKYIEQAIQDADRCIKQESAADKEKEGMGSTIVIAWILGQKVYVGWCGDSRCYRFNPARGLERLSHDHSYVQELVDAGKLSEELAFDHPNSNIITRSLGDPNGVAKPDTQCFELYNDDVILLCSDGLCGTLRDNEIADIMAANMSSMVQMRDALWNADEQAGWHDNVTILMAHITSGATQLSPKPISEPAPVVAAAIKPETTETPEQPTMSQSNKLRKANNKLMKIIIVLLLLLLCGGAVGGYFIWKGHSKLQQSAPNEAVEQTNQEQGVENEADKDNQEDEKQKDETKIEVKKTTPQKKGDKDKKEDKTNNPPALDEMKKELEKSLPEKGQVKEQTKEQEKTEESELSPIKNGSELTETPQQGNNSAANEDGLTPAPANDEKE